MTPSDQNDWSYAVRQFLLSMIVEAQEVLENQQVHHYGRLVEIDLLHPNAASMLLNLPKNLSGRSAMLMAITNDEGITATYIDGSLPSDEYSGEGEREWVPIVDLGEDYVRDLHAQVRDIADDRLRRGSGTESEAQVVGLDKYGVPTRE